MGEVLLEIEVRCTEIDVNGHVNNARFVEYLEWGRELWYDEHNLGYERLHAAGAITVTANIHLDFRKEARQGDRLTIATRPSRVGRTSFAFRQELRRGVEKVAEATVTMVAVDPETRRPTPLPEILASHLSGGLEGV